MNRRQRFTIVCLVLFSLAMAGLWWMGPANSSPPSGADATGQASSSHDQPSPATENSRRADLTGEALARIYCATCHLFPEPGLLDRSAWIHGALPEMRPWLGLSPPQIERARDGQPVLLTNLFPESPLLSTQEWLRLTDYYEQDAPESLTSQTPAPPPLAALRQFKVEVVPYIRDVAMVSMVRIDPAARRYFIGDAMTRTLEALTETGERAFTVEFISGPIDLRARPDGLDVLLPGRLFPSDQLKGAWLRLVPEPERESMDMTKRLDQLRRPTDFEFADLNGDGREDVVICQFGHRLGRLSWFELQPDGEYREHLLLERAGATAAVVRDFDGDGRPDILALLAQAWEGVSLFLNQGDNRFVERKLLEKPPTFGYAGLEVMDWNGDGHLDFVTVNGDNGEYPPPVKPYHGLRLYLNDGRGAFREAWFEPLPGAYQARVRDFDLDGDMDVAAVSFFPDYERAPTSGFLYLENVGGDEFARSTFAQSTAGRWITLDAGDIDGDGDEDVALGSLVRGPTTIPIPSEISDRWQRRSPPVLLLRNQAR